MKKNLKYFATEYKKGNVEVLNELITKRLNAERTNSGNINHVERLRFEDKALDSIYFQICKTYGWLDYKDIDNYILTAFYNIKEDGTVTSIFDNVDVTRTPQEVLKFIERKLKGNIHNQIEKSDKEYYSHTIPDEFANDKVYFADDEKEDGTFKVSDGAVVNDYTSVEDKLSPYKEFIEFVGGDIKNLLSKNQQIMYNLLQDVSKTEKDIASEYGCTQQAVSDMKKTIENRIKKKFIEFKTLKGMVANRDTYRAILGFIQQHKQIITYDTTDSFDYFGYFINFLESNYIENEQEIEVYDLHKNKMDYSFSIIDVVVDYSNANTYKVLNEYILNRNIDLKYTQRVKDSFVMNVLKSFDKYIKDVDKAVQGLNERVAKEGDSQKYIDLLI